MTKQRNPVDAAFARGEQPRHQIHQDRRKQRHVKHRLRPEIEFDGD